MAIFVVQKHFARNLHFDFRLEIDKVLKSWAIPKEISLDPKVKRLAVQVPDHPLSYGNFEGVIEECYGKGKVEIWDRGKLKIEYRKDYKIVFELQGKRLKGKFVLVKLKKDDKKDKNWLFFKKKED